ncbi:uncharacterized protein LOC133815911 [Humulus lupulus]|uniref:uncharacterized protein LOC133815911 n=1 Tax=Humulus lupulus TaxID=3486 RepID=UPI002B4058FC|nr:uncharacterized protein LOC133815911 [Humulus lupulus]
MDGARDRSTTWSSIKQRLGLKGIGCCGATWSPTSSTLTIMETLQEDEEEHHNHHHHQAEPVAVVVGPVPGMNLAMALAAERNSRAAGDEVGPTSVTGQVKSLMTLIEETDGVDWSNRKKKERDHNNKRGTIDGNGVGTGKAKGGDIDWVCCVCMERSKGAAFIPCGHTFCRVCSREMLINRGACPVCNRPILEVLDIF